MTCSQFSGSHIVTERFDGVSSVVRAVTDYPGDAWTRGPFIQNAQSRDAFKSSTGDASWYGSASKEAVRAELGGDWTRGFARIDKNLKTLSAPAVQSVRRSQVWSDAGDNVDMDKVWGGNLETAWRTSKRLSRTIPPSFRLIVSCGISAYTSADVLFWKGAATIRLAQALSDAGYNLEIVTVKACQPSISGPFKPGFSDKTIWIHEIKIKDFQSPFNLNACGVALAHPGFVRAALFQHNFNTYAQAGDVSSMLSYPKHLEEGDLGLLGYESANVRNVLMSNGDDFKDATTTNAFLARALAGLAGED